MSLHALDNVSDALDVTRSFLGDVGRWTWLKLALIMFFIGGGASFPSSFNPSPSTSQNGMDQPFLTDPGPDVWLLLAAVVGVVLLFTVVFGVIGATMQFIFVESLRSKTVAIRAYWSQYWPQGARLFGFNFVLSLLMLAAIAAMAAVFLAPLLGLGGIESIFILIALIPVALIVIIVIGLITSFTTQLVVPIMMLEDCGVIAGWRRLWPSVRAEWKEYLAYAVGAWILSMVGGILAVLLFAVAAVAIAIPFALLGGIGTVLLSVAEPLGIAVLVVVGIVFMVLLILAYLLAMVPVQTYLRYYALLVLGDIETEFDLIPDQRNAVRADPADDASGADADA
jgi:hypothetical protein